MSWLDLSASFEYPCYGFMTILNSLLFQCRDRIMTSKSDVYRRQILTSNEKIELIFELTDQPVTEHLRLFRTYIKYKIMDL